MSYEKWSFFRRGFAYEMFVRVTAIRMNELANIS